MATGVRWMRAAAFGAALLAAGCGAPGTAPFEGCTQIGASAGISVTVTAERAPTVRSLDLAVCWDGLCREPELALAPGSASVDLGCGADGICSASASPDGTLVGFAPVELPDGEVEVRATVTDDAGRPEVLAPLRAAADRVYPNGRRCPGEAQQLGLTLDGSGLQADRAASPAG